MGKRILMIDGHPDPDRARFCHALAETYLDAAHSAGHQTRLIVLAEAEFPLLRTAAEFGAPPEDPLVRRGQDDILWAEHIVMVFPLWLGGAPSLLRAFLEQVARAQFVATVGPRGPKPNLTGRSARLIVTMGMPEFLYRFWFHAHGVKNIVQGVLGLGGVKPIHVTLFGGVEAGGARLAKERLARVTALGRSAL